jgi:predicted nucleic acid-binding protein
VKLAYFDSSALLAFLMQQPGGEETGELWNQVDGKVASLLLDAECLISLRRNALRVQGIDGEKWLTPRLSALSQLLQEITLKEFDTSIQEVIRRENLLSECRTLDAIHLATALYFREQGGEDFGIVSLDEKMRRTSLKMGLPVWPATWKGRESAS